MPSGGALGPSIERIWPSLPTGTKIAILTIMGGIAIKWGFDDIRTPYNRTKGAFFIVMGVVMLLVGIGALLGNSS